jgi:hypothetical protein
VFDTTVDDGFDLFKKVPTSTGNMIEITVRSEHLNAGAKDALEGLISRGTSIKATIDTFNLQCSVRNSIRCCITNS